MRQIFKIFCVLFLSFSGYCLEICGHRGARGLSPENTLEGFRHALQLNISCIDMDVVLSKDGIPVVYHDLRLNPDTTKHRNGAWVKPLDYAIKDLSYSELKEYNIGQLNPQRHYQTLFSQQKPVKNAQIESLDKVLSFIQLNKKTTTHIQIELKSDPSDPATPDYKKLTTATLEIIQKHHLENNIKIQSFDWRCLEYLKTLNPKISRAYLTENNPKAWEKKQQFTKYVSSIPLLIKKRGGNYWDAEDIQLNKKLIDEAHVLGLKVCSWSNSVKKKINSISLEKQLIEYGIDCIITDRPDLTSLLSTHNK